MGNADSKAGIRRAVISLCSQPLNEEQPAWDAFWIDTTAEDVFESISMEDVRTMLRRQPRNLVLLIRKIVAILEALCANPDPKHFPVTMTAVRILTRIIPVLQEDPGSGFLRKVMWENRVPPAHQEEGEAAGAAAAPPPNPPKRTVLRSSQYVEPERLDSGEVALGSLLVDAVYQLCFLPNLTVPRDQYTLWADARQRELKEQQAAAEAAAAATAAAEAEAEAAAGEEEGKQGGAGGGAGGGTGAPEDLDELPSTAVVETLLLWSPGVGFPTVPVSSTASMNRNRVEILRLMLVLLCGPLYYLPDASSPARDRFCTEFVSPRRPLLPTLFYSLLNSVLAYDPVGWGIPYGSSMVSDTEEPLMNAALQVLLACLDYAPTRDCIADHNDTYGFEATHSAHQGSADGEIKPAAPTEGGGEVDTTAEGEGTAPTEDSNAPPAEDTAGETSTEASKVDEAVAGTPADAAGATDAADGSGADAAATSAEADAAGAGAVGASDNGNATDTNANAASDEGADAATEEGKAAPAPVPDTQRGPAPSVVQVPIPNLYRGLLAGLNSAGDFKILLNGIIKLLNHIHHADNTYLPYSMKQLDNHQEVLVLLWKAMDTNPDFLSFLLSQPDALNHVVVPILYYMFQARSKSSRVGLVHICTFTLLLLSGAREFGVALNTEFTEQLPAHLPLFRGNHADLLIIVMHKLIVGGNDALKPLFSCFLTIINNVSAYVKELSMVASVKLVNLFELFASPKFIFRQPMNHTFVEQLCMVFNNIVQYQYTGNAHLVYSLLRRKQAFYTLFRLGEKLESFNAAIDATGASGAGAGAGAAAGAGAGAAAGGGDTSAETAPPAPWRPTAAWLAKWHPKVLLEPLIRLINYLAPQMEAMCVQAVDDIAVLEFLRKTTVVGVLPVPHAIMMRRYQANEYTHLWFSTFMWGNVFLRIQDLTLMDARTILLFSITFAPTPSS